MPQLCQHLMQQTRCPAPVSLDSPSPVLYPRACSAVTACALYHMHSHDFMHMQGPQNSLEWHHSMAAT